MRRQPVPRAHRHPIFARVYPRIAHTAERGGAAEHRRSLLDGLTGRVIEVGAGHGLNFPYYTEGVTQVLAVEPEPYLRGLAERASASASVPVEVADGIAEALPAADGEFDAAIASLVLCSVDDQQAALREILRVLRPDGELRYYEHVISRSPRMARVQRALDATVYPSLTGGCHCARDTGAAITEAGFRVEREKRIEFKPSRLVPPIPHILGDARAPQAASA
jgi:ubiquinone/menaquinone biosynthesis C-methylase UbiE